MRAIGQTLKKVGTEKCIILMAIDMREIGSMIENKELVSFIKMEST